jgi:leucyl/phenylalanyl-tRNA---protein transferase
MPCDSLRAFEMALALRLEIHDIGPARPVRRSASGFPDADWTESSGGVAPRRGFAPGAIVEACQLGIAPSPHPERGLWFSPDPRAIIVPCNLQVPGELEQTIRAGKVYVSLDAVFERVLAACAEREEGNWITAEYRHAYLRLHQLGWAHSFEVWTVSGQLAGGLYGLNVGGLFSVESAFDEAPGASNVATVAMAQHSQNVGVTLIDVRVMTPHLASIGAVTIARAEYLEWVRGVAHREVSFAGDPCQLEPVPAGDFALFDGWL